jgi:hypothetical protein
MKIQNTAYYNVQRLKREREREREKIETAKN